MSTFYDLPADEAQETIIYIHPVYREDARLLFGFSRIADRDFFAEILKVNGIGPRMALAVLSSFSAGDFRQAVEMGEVDRLVKVPGIGRKTAERLVLEMRGRLDDLLQGTAAAQGEAAAPASLRGDAIAALQALGYKPADATRAVKAVETPEMSSEALIRAALQQLTGGKR
jgi:Holliday junction DNA helicase RuvA